MAKVHLMTNARTFPVSMEIEGGATPIVPLSAVVLQFAAPQAIDEWEIPPAPVSIALVPEMARLLAQSLLATANRLD